MTFFGKNFHFHAKNSDDLFLVIYQVFLIFTLFRFSVSLLCKMSYMTLSSQEKALFQKSILNDTYFFYSVRAFTPIPQHYFSKYWGDQCIGRPHLKFWGTVPPVPPRSPPLHLLPFLSKLLERVVSVQLADY